MSFGETIISALLLVIAYFLYHIAKQLSYLTGKRIKITLFNKELYNGLKRKFTEEKKTKEKPSPRLPN